MNNMTYNDLVRKYFPKATDDEVDFILWEHTGFPAFFSDIKELEQQIKDFKLKREKDKLE